MAQTGVILPAANVPIYPTISQFPASAAANQLATALDTGDLYEFHNGTWELLANPSGSGVTSLNTLTGALSIVAGAGISITPSGFNITIANTQPAGITQLTGDVTAGPGSGSQAATVAKIQGTLVSGTTGTGDVVFSASPTLTGTTLANNITASGKLLTADLGSDLINPVVGIYGSATTQFGFAIVGGLGGSPAIVGYNGFEFVSWNTSNGKANFSASVNTSSQFSSSVNSPAFLIGSDNLTGWYEVSTGSWGFTSGGNQTLQLNSSSLQILTTTQIGAASTTPQHTLNTATATGSGTSTLGTANSPGAATPAGWIEITINGATHYIPYF